MNQRPLSYSPAPSATPRAPASVPLSPPPTVVKRWWTLPTQLLVLILAYWLVTQYASLVPQWTALAVSRHTSGDLKCGAVRVAPLTERVVVREVEWRHRHRDAIVQQIAATNIEATVSVWELLFRRIHLTHLVIEGGTVSIREPVIESVARQLFGLAPLVAERVSKSLISDETAFLLSGQPDMLTPILAQKLETYRVAHELRAKWQPQWERAEALARTVRARVETLRTAATDPQRGGAVLASLPQLLTEAATLEQQVRELAADFATLESQSRDDIARLRAAVATDQRTLQSLTLPPLDLEPLSQQLLGTDLIELARTTLRNQEAFFAALDKTTSSAASPATSPSGNQPSEDDPSSGVETRPHLAPLFPPVSADRIDLDGQILVGDLPLYWRGVVCSAVVPRSRATQPLQAQFCLDPTSLPEAVAAASLSASDPSRPAPLYVNLVLGQRDDQHDAPYDQLTLQQPCYRMPEMRLGDDRTLAIILGAMNVRLDAVLERNDTTVSLAIRLRGENASVKPVFPPQLGESSIGRQLTAALAGLPTVVVDARVEGRRHLGNDASQSEPVFTVQSNVANLVTRSLQGIVATEWDRVRSDLLASMDQQSADVLATLSGARGEALIASLRQEMAPLLKLPMSNGLPAALPVTIPAGLLPEDRPPGIDTIWKTIRGAVNSN